MRDSDIRRAVDAHLLAEHAEHADTLIRHELGICAGKRRVDIALINGEIAGYEIKSDEDTLVRLAGQADAYAKVFDRAVMITTPKYIEKVFDILPEWWGVIVATSDGGRVCLEESRPPGVNMQHDAYSVAQLLWREEALDELRQRGAAQGLSKKARHYVWEALIDVVDLDELRAIARSRLKARREW